MKKQKLLHVFLILLPAMAVALATTVDSVTVFNRVTGAVDYYSYFHLVPGDPMQILPPVAAILSVVATVFAVIAVAGRKEKFLVWVKWLSLAAAFAAVMPILRRGEQILVIPNAVLPLLMMIEWAVAFYVEKSKTPANHKEKHHQGQRLR